jgi:DNA-binding CsgD family transcriptional regulator
VLGGDSDAGAAHLEASRALHRRRGVRTGEARATAALGLARLMAGERVRGRELVEEALAVNETVDDDWGRGQCHLYLGIIAESTGRDPSGASLHLRRAVELLRQFRGGPLLPVALVEQAGVLVRREPARALRVAAAAATIRARTGGVYAPFYRARAQRVRSAAEAALGPEAARIWAEGERLRVDDAIAIAFGAERPRPQQPAGLSEREVAIGRLVADGLSNKLIATRLHLSVRTVESHVRHALAKAGLENRTQLATWVRERIQ